MSNNIESKITKHRSGNEIDVTINGVKIESITYNEAEELCGILNDFLVMCDSEV